MKKSLVLGAAAVAAMAFAAPVAEAGEVKMGGYYMFRALTGDNTLANDSAGGLDVDDDNYWVHRLQMNMDFIASPKSHAHMVTRPLDAATVEGASSVNSGNVNSGAANNWRVKQAWLETEMWTVGVKVGEMPIALNDGLLVNYDGDSFGAIMLSKTFGNTTAVLANVKVAEGLRGVQSDSTTTTTAVDANGFVTSTTATNTNQDEDDVDLYVLSLLGKTPRVCNGCMNWQATAAYLDAGNTSILNTGGLNTNNLWLAGTLGTKWNGIDLVATAIYEDGYDNYATTTQMAQDDYLLALRANGKLSWGKWNAYAAYAGENFNNIVADGAAWSATWDSGGPGAKDLMDVWATSVGAAMTQNMMTVGAGVKFNAAGWTINPMVDYASLAEDTIGGVQAISDSAWGGTLKLSHVIDQGVTFGVQASYVDPDQTSTGSATTVDSMHYLAADIKMAF